MITAFGQQGIIDTRSTGNTRLSVRNTTISNNIGAGISQFATNGSFTVLDNVLSLNNSFGVSVASGNNVLIKNSVLSGGGTGVFAGAGGQVQINDSAISNNLTGLNAAGVIKVATRI